ncbi:MAG: thiamine-phosphate diphosphorylase [Polyangiales bacterium]|jgi:thiamine-phosphate diphosphorylase
MIPALLWITPPDGPFDFMGDILKRSLDDLSSLAVLYRRPGENTRERVRHARPLREQCVQRGVRFLTQDLELALCVGADGVHLPERGVPLSAIRPHVGLLGASRHSREGLQRAFDAGADYCTLSPVFASPGKGPPLGLETFRSLSLGLGPILALGGVVDSASAEAARAHGAAGAATIRGVRSVAELAALLSPFAPSS